MTRKPQDPAAVVGITDLRLPGHFRLLDIHARDDRSEWSHTFQRQSRTQTPPVNALHWQYASNTLAIVIWDLLETVCDSVRSKSRVASPIDQP
jgi:hypothetical protein